MSGVDFSERAKPLAQAYALCEVERMRLAACLAAAETALRDEVAMADQSVVTLRDLRKNWRRIIEEQDPDGGPLIENILYWLIEDVTPSSEARSLASPQGRSDV